MCLFFKFSRKKAFSMMFPVKIFETFYSVLVGFAPEPNAATLD